jgi:hypothetical protein
MCAADCASAGAVIAHINTPATVKRSSAMRFFILHLPMPHCRLIF